MGETREGPQGLRAVFEEALGQEPSARAAYLDRACASDAELRDQVLRLLAAHHDAQTFLESPAVRSGELFDLLNAAASPRDRADEPPLAEGTMVGPYRVAELLGRGGMGAVYRATDVRLRRDVALKIMAHIESDEGGRAERFVQEARVTASLDHANIVRVYDVGVSESRPYLVVELLHGETLRARIGRGPIPAADARRIAIDVARGLGAAHAAGLVHRDLKPENIFLTRSGVVKILDFGVAKLAPADARRAGASTLTGVVFGTVGYLAPEQVSGQGVDGRTDLFALGAILFEMLTGRRAFAHEHAVDALYAILHNPPPDLLAARSDVPAPLAAIVPRLLEKAPEARFQSAAELEAALEDLDHPGTTSIRVRVRRHRGLIAGSVLAVGVAAALAVSYTRRPPVLTDRDSVLVADFVNATGEEVFDGTLRQALTIDLEQSPFLNVIPRERVRHTLRLMTRSPDDRVVNAVAREACQRLGATLIISGSLAAIGTHYLVALEAANCRSGDQVASEKAESADREHILKALDATSARLRRRLGESRATLQRFATPIAEATTSSLEALKAFQLGSDTRARVGDRAALPFYMHAIELDPDFAMAYVGLASISQNEGRYDEETRFSEEAYARRGRVSERERLHIESRHCYITSEPQNCLATFELWRQTYPRDPVAAIYVCDTCNSLGRFDEAIANCVEAVRLNPDIAISFLDLIESYVGLGRLGEAKLIAEQALTRKLDPPDIHLHLFKIAFALGDRPTMAAQQQWAVGKPAEAEFVALDAEMLASVGRVTESHAVRARAESMAADKQKVDAMRARGALVDAAFGDEGRARTILATLSERGRSTATVDAALAAVLAHDDARAETLLRLPRQGLRPYERVMLDTAGALLAIDAGDRAAIDRVPLPSRGEVIPEAALHPIYVRGLAYLKAGAAGQAIDEFQRILDHPGTAPESPLHALAHVQLARAYALAGERTKARDAYRNFLALWKDADPDVPILKQARSEYARLGQ